MENYYNLRKEANNLRKSHQYGEALKTYNELFSHYPDKTTYWDKWGYAFCLYKMKRYQESIIICEDVYSETQDFEAINNLYALNLFYTKIRNNKEENLHEFLNNAEFILQLINNKYIIYNLTIFEVLDRLNDYGMKHIKKMDNWINKLDFDSLSDKPYAFTNRFGKTQELASEKEKYFMYKIQITYFKQKYNECISLCNQAFETISHLHYNNDIWFKRRLAQSEYKLGNFEKAIDEYLKLIQKKQDWFLLGELGEIYLETNELGKAKTYLLKSILKNGFFDKKVNLLKTIADLYEKENNFEIQNKILNLIYLIRVKNNWKIPYYIDEEKFKQNLDYDELKNKLENFFREELEKLTPFYSGSIIKLFPHGHSGFIKDETDGKTYYFTTKDVENKNKIQVGSKVKFQLKEGFNKKKNEKTINATNILIL